MKILHVIESYSGGGGATAITNLNQVIRRDYSEISCDVLSIKPATVSPAEVQRGGARVFDAPGIEAMLRLLQTEDYDVIHWWWWKPLRFMHLLAKHWPSLGIRAKHLISIVVASRDPQHALGPVESSFGDQFVFNCRTCLDLGQADRLPSENVSMIYLGDAFDGIDSAPIPHAKFRIGRGSRASKCPADMVQVLNRIEIEDAEFAIMTDPRSIPELRRQALELGAESRFEFTAWGSRDEFFRFLRTLDVFCYHVPSEIYSAIDFVVQDAMFCKIPVVLLTGPGPRELIEHDVSGLIAQDPADLARCCERLHADPELRARIGQGGHDRLMRDFAAEVTTAQYVELYRALSNNQRASNQSRPGNRNWANAAIRLNWTAANALDSIRGISAKCLGYAHGFVMKYAPQTKKRN